MSNKQIVKLDSKYGDPFEAKRYVIPVAKNTPGELVKDYDLGISTDDYVVSITSANLIKGGINSTDTAPTMSIQSITETIVGDHSQYENGITDVVVSKIGSTPGANYGWLTGIAGHNMQGNLYSGTIAVPQSETRNFLFYPVPKIYLTTDKTSKTYKFTGFYQDSEDLLVNQTKYWVVEVFIVNKNWVREHETVNVVVEHPSKDPNTRATIKRSSGGAHPAVQ